MDELINVLLNDSYTVELETNGSILIDKIHDDVIISMDYKLSSSGMNIKMNNDNLYLLNEYDQLKFIIGNENDYIIAKEIINKYNKEFELCNNIIMIPVWSKNWNMDLKHLSKKVLNDNLGIKVLPQLHKIIGVK